MSLVLKDRLELRLVYVEWCKYISKPAETNLDRWMLSNEKLVTETLL